MEQHGFIVPIKQVNLPPGTAHGIHFTMVTSTSLNPVQLVLPRDVYRAKAVIVVCDEPVVLATSKEMAQNANNQNQATVGLVPSGAYLPSGTSVTIDHCEEVWLAATSSTAGRVSVFISQVAFSGSQHTA